MAQDATRPAGGVVTPRAVFGLTSRVTEPSGIPPRGTPAAATGDAQSRLDGHNGVREAGQHVARPIGGPVSRGDRRPDWPFIAAALLGLAALLEWAARGRAQPAPTHRSAWCSALGAHGAGRVGPGAAGRRPPGWSPARCSSPCSRADVRRWPGWSRCVTVVYVVASATIATRHGPCPHAVRCCTRVAPLSAADVLLVLTCRRGARRCGRPGAGRGRGAARPPAARSRARWSNTRRGASGRGSRANCTTSSRTTSP